MSQSNPELQRANQLLDKGTALAEKGEYSQALIYFKDALAIKLRLIAQGEDLKVDLNYINVGLTYLHLSNYSESMANFQTALDDLISRGEEETENAGICYSNIGEVYKRQRKVGESIVYKKKCLNVFLKIHGENSIDIAHSYNGLGTSYFGQGEYETAMSYFQKALSVYLQVVGEQNKYTCFVYINLSSCLQQLKRFEEALDFQLTALQANLKLTPPEHPDFYWYFRNIGNTYKGLKNYGQANKYLLKASNLALKVYGKLHSLTNECDFYLGKCAHEQGKFSEAIDYFKKVYSGNLPHFQAQHFLEHAPINHSLGEYILFEAFRIEATVFFEEYQNNNHNDIKYLHYALNNCQIAALLIHQMSRNSLNQDSKLLFQKNIFRLSELAIQVAFVAAKIAKTSPKAFEEASQAVRQINTRWYATQKLQYTDNEQDCWKLIFRFCEETKNRTLLASFKDDTAKINAHIPKTLLEEEQRLKLTINDLTKKINQEQVKSLEKKDETKIRKWQDQYFDCEQEYQQLIRQFEADYPNYFQLKHQVETVSIEALQKKIPADTVLLEYFVGEKYLTLLCIDSNDCQCVQIVKPNDFEELIEAFKASIDEMDKSEYFELGFELYQLLIPPIVQHQIANVKYSITKIKIIPSGILNTIPFEALLTKEVASNAKYADLPYLLLQCDISYHYSATLWYQNLQNRKDKRAKNQSIVESFVGFAPVYRSEERLKEAAATKGIYNENSTRSIRIGEETYSELVYSEEEVNAVESYFNGKNIPTQTFLHQAANTDNFLQNIGNHKYVLISAHGFYNEEQPDLTGIILSPDDKVSVQHRLSPFQREDSNIAKSSAAEKKPSTASSLPRRAQAGGIFYLCDAYNLKLNADLVVLSCCETGVGKMAIGEGVMALNRGFFYAGAKNVIYTLFKVYDQASCQLTQYLFQHILEQKHYSSALKEAKRQLILQGKAPIHWAGYLLIGE